jgi:uncharacterized membrane protein
MKSTKTDAPWCKNLPTGSLVLPGAFRFFSSTSGSSLSGSSSINWLHIPGIPQFDPYPFGFLTLAVSLEAIFLSVFVLLSQNRQAAKDRVHADIEYDVNLKAELEIAHLHEKIDRLTGDLLVRLDRVHRLLPKNTDLDIATAEVETLHSARGNSTKVERE